MRRPVKVDISELSVTGFDRTQADALATLKRDFAKPGAILEMEMTVEAVRHRVRATVVKTPFFNPKRKTSTPIL